MGYPSTTRCGAGTNVSVVWLFFGRGVSVGVKVPTCATPRRWWPILLVSVQIAVQSAHPPLRTLSHACHATGTVPAPQPTATLPSTPLSLTVSKKVVSSERFDAG